MLLPLWLAHFSASTNLDAPPPAAPACPSPPFLLPPNCPSTTPPPSFHQCQSASPPPQYPPCSSVLCPAVHTSSSTLFCIESNLRDKLINLTRDRFIQRQGQKCTWSSDFRQSADKLMNVEKE